MSRPTWPFALLLFAAASTRAADAPDFMAALDAYEQKQYQRCADILAALQREAIPSPRGGALLHAECLGAAGHVDEALGYLDDELVNGQVGIDDLRNKDRPGLNAIRKSPKWPALLGKAERLDSERQARIDQPLRKELLTRGDEDQRVRNATIDSGNSAEAWKQVEPVDQDNTAWLKRVIASRGWPGISLVGTDGNRAAFLIVQHSLDVDFQAQMLPILETAYAKRDIDAEELALLTDRVLRKQGKPQRYGSQFKDNDDGSMSMQPVEDEANLDARRRKMGMEPIAEYKKRLSDVYRKPVR